MMMVINTFFLSRVTILRYAFITKTLTQTLTLAYTFIHSHTFIANTAKLWQKCKLHHHQPKKGEEKLRTTKNKLQNATYL